MEKRVHRTTEFKQQFIENFLLARRNDPTLSLSRYCLENGPDINYKTATNWYRLYKSAIGQKINMSENEVNNKFGTEANELTLEQKFKIVLDTTNLSEEEFGEYCRKKGIYASDVEQWKSECASALSGLPSGKVTAQLVKEKNTKIKQLKSKVEKLEKLNKRQEREIDKRDKSLAVYAAKVISLKNFHQLFTDKEGD